MARVSIKVHESSLGKFIAMCDENLLGQTLEGDDLKITLSDFYKGEIYDESEVPDELFKDILSINAVGEASLRVLRKKGIIKEGENQAIRYIESTPIILVFYV